ncbi:MAG TPA: hypothetical protein VL443_17615 [Cyclobacteriaceae bacterium]|jgi:hypothetical protein|nr:hypothetical protein [Cyclobacteriaceae bacterium]
MLKNLPKTVIVLSIFTFSFIPFTNTIIAQSFQIEESDPFPEPEKGSLKIILLPNGNTALLHIEEKSINYRLFDSEQKMVLQRPISKGHSSSNTNLVSIFTVGSDIVLFYNALENRTPVLYRTVIDSGSGKILKDEEIGRLNKFKMFAGYAMAFGAVPPPNFYIRKDRNSDCYAVGLFNSFEQDRNKRIEIRHYNGKHEVINKAFYVSPNDEFKYMELVDLIVLGSEKVIACAYVFNTSGDKVSYLSLAQLQVGSTSIQIKQLDFTEGFRITNGILRQVPGTDMVALLGLAGVNGAFLSFLNTKTLSLEYNKTINIAGLHNEYKKIFGPKSEYHGVPLDLYVNEDGTYTLVFEEITTIYSQHVSITSLGTTGVTIMDKDAREIQSYIIPKLHSRTMHYGPMYMSERFDKPKGLYMGDQYKSFAYVNSSGKKYIFLNDLAENLEHLKSGKLATVSTVSDTDAFSFTLNDGKVDRQFMFGQPEKKCHAIGMFSVSDYDQRSGTYVTLKLDNCKDVKKIRMIWTNLK